MQVMSPKRPSNSGKIGPNKHSSMQMHSENSDTLQFSQQQDVTDSEDKRKEAWICDNYKQSNSLSGNSTSSLEESDLSGEAHVEPLKPVRKDGRVSPVSD